MSRYDGSDTYTYPHSEVLQNKAGLHEQAGYFIDFDEVSREEMYHAMITSFLGDNTPLIALLDRICSVIE